MAKRKSSRVSTKRRPKRKSPVRRRSPGPMLAYQPPVQRQRGGGNGMMLVGVVIMIAIIVAVFMSLDEGTKRQLFGGTTQAPLTTTSAPAGGMGGMGTGTIVAIVLVVLAVIGAIMMQQDVAGSRTFVTEQANNIYNELLRRGVPDTEAAAAATKVDAEKLAES